MPRWSSYPQSAAPGSFLSSSSNLIDPLSPILLVKCKMMISTAGVLMPELSQR